MTDADFLHAFLDEAFEILESLEARCLELEKAATPELLNELFRYAHNLKGSSRSVGLEQYGQCVHKLEDLFTELKEQPERINSAMIGLILEVQSSLVHWTEKLRKDRDAVEHVGHLIQRMDREIRPSTESQAPTAAFGFFEEVVPTKLEAPPPVAPPVSSVPKTVVSDSKGVSGDETIRVSLRRLDSLIRLIGELSIQHSIVANAKENQTLDSQQSHDAINLSKKVIQDLQTEAMGLRMQSLEGLFQRLDRVARDVARSQHKPLEIILRGSDVELDKTVIEHMKDPLIHIIRNAVDHGLEAPDERQAKQKGNKGSILIEGRQNAANVIIRIEDNGRGLDPERIKRKAIEKGLIPKGASLSQSEIFRLIFLPGFSTAEKITDVSGRGVGMDVVNKAVEELNGTIEIDSKVSEGTCFEITLPSTLSILDAIIIRLGQLNYAIPVQDVTEVVDLSAIPIETTSQKGRVLNLRGHILPVEKLAEYLPEKVKSSTDLSHSHSQASVALITTVHKLSVAFEVDAIVGQQSIVVRKLDGKLADVPGFSGGTILPNGEPSMILHLARFVKSYLSQVA